MLDLQDLAILGETIVGPRAPSPLATWVGGGDVPREREPSAAGMHRLWKPRRHAALWYYAHDAKQLQLKGAIHYST